MIRRRGPAPLRRGGMVRGTVSERGDLVGNCAEVIPEIAGRGVIPDLLTDQTSAHDPLNGYVPAGLSLESGASWVSFHHGGGVGIGNSLHAGQVLVADGSAEMSERIRRVLTNDPGIGVVRHADAGYQKAVETAEREGLLIPMWES